MDLKGSNNMGASCPTNTIYKRGGKDENSRNLRFSHFNYCLDTDLTSPKYSICKSWNSLPFEIKSTQPDEFLDTLRNYFNSCNDKVCQMENCWLCGPK